MKKIVPIKYTLYICYALTAILTISLSARSVLAGSVGDSSAAGAPHQTAWSSPLSLFQRVISRADGDRCPMTPSCSHYAATVFKQYHPVTAYILTCDRLLRCGHDEVRLAPRIYADGHARAFDPVAANTFWWRKP
jgi:uncharacterized protein